MYLLLAYPLQAMSATLFLQQLSELPECLGIWDTDTYCWDTVAPIRSVTYNWEKQTQVWFFSFSLFSFSTFSTNVSTGNHAESICLLKTVPPQLSGSFFCGGEKAKERENNHRKKTLHRILLMQREHWQIGRVSILKLGKFECLLLKGKVRLTC